MTKNELEELKFWAKEFVNTYSKEQLESMLNEISVFQKARIYITKEDNVLGYQIRNSKIFMYQDVEGNIYFFDSEDDSKESEMNALTFNLG